MPDVRLIDADATKEKLGFAIEPFIGSAADEIRNDTLLKAIAIVDSMPTVDAQPVKHGHWILHFDDLFPEESTIECSVCHEHSSADMSYDNFCPNCGSYNRGDTDD